MKHYEVILMIRPDQDDPQLEKILPRCKELLGVDNFHRYEDWGRKPLAYQIQNEQKARYVLFNVECCPSTISKFTTYLLHNKAIMRHLIVIQKSAITEPSPFMLSDDEKSKDKNDKENRSSSESNSDKKTDNKVVESVASNEDAEKNSANENDSVADDTVIKNDKKEDKE